MRREKNFIGSDFKRCKRAAAGRKTEEKKGGGRQNAVFDGEIQTYRCGTMCCVLNLRHVNGSYQQATFTPCLQ